MSLPLKSIYATNNTTSPRLPLSPTHFVKPSNLPFSLPNSRTQFQNHTFLTPQPRILRATKIYAAFDDTSLSQVNSSRSSSNAFNFDAFLAILEFLSLASSAAISIYVAVSSVIRKGGFSGWVGSKIFGWQCVFLVSSAVVGAAIRRRQWSRVSMAGFSRGSASNGVDLLGRVEVMEEELRSSATIIRVLSRHLEKLGTRVRVARSTLKDSIAETAALAQKNSEATRALAAQEENLEKGLAEIQDVLLAMQEQQQKQLELILAIGKAGKFLHEGPPPTEDNDNPSETSNSAAAADDGVANSETDQIESLAVNNGST